LHPAQGIRAAKPDVVPVWEELTGGKTETGRRADFAER